MKKGLVIGLVIAIVGIVGYLATHPPAKPVSSEGTETSAQLEAAANPPEAAPAQETAPTAETPAAVPAATAEATPAPATDAPATAAATPINTDKIDIESALTERILGDQAAPVTVIEYASLTCPHCAHFSTTILPEVKAKLVATGKMRLVFRDFPLDATAMKAAKMARCAPHDKYFDLIEVIFSNRERWLSADDPIKALMQLGALTGMNDDYMKKCIDSPELETGILNGVSDAQKKFTIKSTPTFVFNYGAESFAGAQDETKFEEVVNRLSAGK